MKRSFVHRLDSLVFAIRLFIQPGGFFRLVMASEVAYLILYPVMRRYVYDFSTILVRTPIQFVVQSRLMEPFTNHCIRINWQ